MHLKTHICYLMPDYGSNNKQAVAYIGSVFATASENRTLLKQEAKKLLE